MNADESDNNSEEPARHRRIRADQLDAVRRMQETMRRLVRPYEHVLDQARNQLRIAEQASRLYEPAMLRLAAQGQALVKNIALPRFEIPNWDRIAEQFERLDKESRPGNWRDLSPEELLAVGDLMDRTGWGLAWVPRAELLYELLEASDAEVAQQRLMAKQALVVEDLRTCLSEVTLAEFADLRVALEQAIAAFEAGLSLPAQSMVATVLTSVIQHQLQTKLGELHKQWKQIDPDNEAFFAYRQNVVRRAVASSLESYWPDRGDPVPSCFNRHASAHSLDLTQFNEVNALGGLLLAVAFLRELQAETDEDWPDD